MSYSFYQRSRQSYRLKNYDYSRNGLYFITIITHQRQRFFGKVKNKKLKLSPEGQMADKFWLEIPQHYPFVVLHEYVVMPNHVHGILEIANPDREPGFIGLSMASVTVQNSEPLPMPWRRIAPFTEIGRQHKYQKIIPGSIGAIVRGYKIGVTKWFRQNTNVYKVWHRNYHDHIIRDEESYYRISKYIKNNPIMWKEDRFYI